MTMINLEYPLLILKNAKLATAGFKYINSSWTSKFTIESQWIDVKNAYGPFILGVSLLDKTLKVLELGGPMDN